MNTSLSRISYTDALPELVPGGWGRTHPWTHPHLPPTGRPAPAPPSRLQQLLRSLQTVDRYQISSVSSVYIEQLLYLVRGHLLGPARLPQPDCLVPDMYALFDIVINRLFDNLSPPIIGPLVSISPFWASSNIANMSAWSCCVVRSAREVLRPSMVAGAWQRQRPGYVLSRPRPRLRPHDSINSYQPLYLL